MASKLLSSAHDPLEVLLPDLSVLHHQRKVNTLSITHSMSSGRLAVIWKPGARHHVKATVLFRTARLAHFAVRLFRERTRESRIRRICRVCCWCSLHVLACQNQHGISHDVTFVRRLTLAVQLRIPERWFWRAHRDKNRSNITSVSVGQILCRHLNTVRFSADVYTKACPLSSYAAH